MRLGVVMKRGVMCAVGLLATLAIVGCGPAQLSINYLRVNSSGTATLGDPTNNLVLRGQIGCNRDNVVGLPEPVDAFLRVKTEGRWYNLDEANNYTTCGRGRHGWTLNWNFPQEVEIDDGQSVPVEIEFCTNPADVRDEDCSTVDRTVVFTVSTSS
jgi:hypothetical protein